MRSVIISLTKSGNYKIIVKDNNGNYVFSRKFILIKNPQIGSIEIGKKADLLIVEENPLENLKVLYGTGAIKLNEENEAVRVGGVKYTIKDGIVFDSKLLLKDVREIVRKSKDDLKYEIYQPGNKNDFLNTINKTKD